MTKHAIRAHVTRRNFIKGVGLLSASAALAACTQAKDDVQTSDDTQAATAAVPLLAIIHTNDTHGHDVAVEGTDSVDGNFSMAAVPALKAEWEKKGYEVLVVDAGDATQGMPLVDTQNSAPAITFMNACGYDLMAVDNHEFDWGADALAANEQVATFPFLSANVLVKATGEQRFVPNKVVEARKWYQGGLLWPHDAHDHNFDESQGRGELLVFGRGRPVCVRKGAGAGAARPSVRPRGVRGASWQQGDQRHERGRAQQRRGD